MAKDFELLFYTGFTVFVREHTQQFQVKFKSCANRVMSLLFSVGMFFKSVHPYFYSQLSVVKIFK